MRGTSLAARYLADLLGLSVMWLGCQVPTMGDVIVLRGGGQVQGKIVPDPIDKVHVSVFLLQGKHPLRLRNEQISEVIPKPSPLDSYVVKRSRSAPTAAAEFELGLWCEMHKLSDLSRHHYEAALTRDPSFEAAHLKLGHLKREHRWVTSEESRSVYGIARNKGRLDPLDEKTRIDQKAPISSNQASWLRRIKLLKEAISSGDAIRRRNAEEELMKIRESDAVPPLLKTLARDEPAMRRLAADVLGVIPGKESAQALVGLLLNEGDGGVRESIMGALQARNDDEPSILPLLNNALRSANIRVLNRAAWALGNLGATSAVPRLVSALISTDQEIVFDGNDGGTAPQLEPGQVPGALLGVNRTGTYAAYLTPPAVGPGVVAFGVTTVPWYENPGFGGGLLPSPMIGGGPQINLGAGPNRGPLPRLVSYNYENVEVRSALTKLTGQDFGYDIDAWKRWISASFNPDPGPLRKVPQP